MEKLSSKLVIALAFVVIIFSMMQLSVYATNENMEIVKKSDIEYLIYIKDNLNTDFYFAFSNDKNTEPEKLTYVKSAKDSAESNANSIAYVDSSNVSMFDKTTYMWLKDSSDKVKIAALEINLNDNISVEELENVNDISKTIKISLEQEKVVDEVNSEGVKITETVGVVKLVDELQDGEYQLIKRTETGANNDFFALAELIEKNEFVDIYTRINASKNFLQLYNAQYRALSSEDWQKIENGTVYQPNEAKTGDQYILWVKDGNVKDVHFLTSYREYEEEFIKEEITTKLPYTYDSNTLYVALAVVLSSIVVVSALIIFSKRKENSVEK